VRMAPSYTVPGQFVKEDGSTDVAKEGMKNEKYRKISVSITAFYPLKIP